MILRSILVLMLASMAMACGDDADTAGNGPGTPDPQPEMQPDPMPDDDRPDPPPDMLPDMVPEPDAQPDPQPEVKPDPCPEQWRDSLSDPVRVEVAEPFSADIGSCTSAWLRLVQPSQTTLALILQDLPSGSHVTVRDALETELASGWVETEDATFDFTTAVSGDVDVVVVPPETAAVAGFEVSGVLSCADGCGRTTTRYPIVLFHGMAGTDNYFGILEYYFGVPDHLAEAGFVAFTPVSQFIGPSQTRAEQLTEQIDAILAETGAEKIHMIGHSQGGIDMRILVSGLGYADKTASMTTIATPHLGIPINLPNFLTGHNFDEDYMQGEFVETYPDVESIPRFSWSGRTCGNLERSCRDEMNGEVVSPLLIASYRLLQAAARDDAYEGANDGIVTVAASIWGEHLGILPTDHFDEVGQIADSREGPFDHLQFYLDEANRLRQLEIDLDL